ncbi:SRP40, C-terminal domain-containing protein [Suillus variegatus]|nr:SRP40, C-terminal domain-containing protein [Suillus variegatus]
MQVTKKRKTSESGAAVVTAVVSTHSTDDVQVSAKVKNIQKNGNGKTPRNANERFSRIKPQNIPAEQLLDNGYEAKGGVTNDYGNRAHQDLIVTRGAGFRKEKNKKKRGSYRGGEITVSMFFFRCRYGHRLIGVAVAKSQYQVHRLDICMVGYTLHKLHSPLPPFAFSSLIH